MSKKRFEVKLVAADSGAVRLILPFDPSEVWGKKSRHRVAAQVNGVDFDASIGARDGQFFIPLNKQVRERAGVAVGDRVKVELTPAEAVPS